MQDRANKSKPVHPVLLREEGRARTAAPLMAPIRKILVTKGLRLPLINGYVLM
jgi:hypothetical protein